MHEDARPKHDRAAIKQVGGKAIAALAGASVGGPFGAVAAVALEPLLIELVSRSWEEISEYRRQSVGLMVQGASERLEIGPDELMSRAFSGREQSELMAAAMYESARTFNSQKLLALSRAVANGLGDDQAKPDEERLIVTALGSLEEPHIKVLLHLPPQRSRPPVPSTGIRSRAISTRGARIVNLTNATKLSSEAVQHVLAELIRTGMASMDSSASSTRTDRLIIELQEEVGKLQRRLDDVKRNAKLRSKTISKPGRPPESGYVRTPFGRLCLDYLEDISPSDEARGQEVEYADDSDAESENDGSHEESGENYLGGD